VNIAARGGHLAHAAMVVVENAELLRERQRDRSLISTNGLAFPGVFVPEVGAIHL
jgi:hypothetical protein